MKNAEAIKQFGNIILDFLYKGKGNFNVKDISKFLAKNKYDDFDISKIQLVYPRIDIKFAYLDAKKDGWTEQEMTMIIK